MSVTCVDNWGLVRVRIIIIIAMFYVVFTSNINVTLNAKSK